MPRLHTSKLQYVHLVVNVHTRHIHETKIAHFWAASRYTRRECADFVSCLEGRRFANKTVNKVWSRRAAAREEEEEEEEEEDGEEEEEGRGRDSKKNMLHQSLSWVCKAVYKQCVRSVDCYSGDDGDKKGSGEEAY